LRSHSGPQKINLDSSGVLKNQFNPSDTPKT
jgi:hypothetical protein